MRPGAPFLLAGLVLALDQVTKFLVRDRLVENESTPILTGVFHFTFVKNTGAAFGIFSQWQTLLLVLGVIAVLVLVYYLLRLGARAAWLQVGLGLALGGVAGNLVDRAFVGFVTDFLDFRFWPAFNIADMAIVSGVIITAAYIVSQQPPERGR